MIHFRAKGELWHSFGRESILGFFSPFIQGSIWLKEEENKSRFGTLTFVVWNTCMEPICMEISHLKYGFVGNETLLTLS